MTPETTQPNEGAPPMTGTTWIDPDESNAIQREKAGQLIDMTRERDSARHPDFLEAMKPAPADTDNTPDMQF